MLLPCTCILSRCRLGVYGVARSSDRHVARRHPSAELARILTDSRYFFSSWVCCWQRRDRAHTTEESGRKERRYRSSHAWLRGVRGWVRACQSVRSRAKSWLYIVFLSHPVSFPFLFYLQPSLFYFPGETIKLSGISEPSLRLVWAQIQPNRQNTQVFLRVCTYL